MKFTILHESCGRIRIHLARNRMSMREADAVEVYLKGITDIKGVKVYDRTCDAVILYSGDRKATIAHLAAVPYEKATAPELVPEHSTRELNREFEDKLVGTVLRRYASKLFLPFPVRAVIAAVKSVRYIGAGLRSLLHGKLSVAVLDATAVSVSLFRGDIATASSVMFMLGLGEILEDWTRKKSVADLAGAMSLNVDKVWVSRDGAESLVALNDVKSGDTVIVRTGNMIPLDGTVISGEVSVNQSSMTGESLPVLKKAGSYVYAGTVAEEGECLVRVDNTAGSGRYDRIVRMIEESEKLKSTTEDKASRLANKLVPYTLGGTVLTYLLTRNITKTLAVLMVDFSCALKLSMPITVLSAMRESSNYHISVKGGRFLEAVAKADTIVFDKTGTLTYATPRVAEIVTFGGKKEEDMLRLAACLEEHYPHSMANAVVAEAAARGLTHEEYHSHIEYVVAHGISSTVNREKVIIGSAHFVFEDEKCTIPAGERDKFDALPHEYSHLYLCISGELAAVICIYDPLRPEAADAIRALHDAGFINIVMMTGDNEQTAQSVAKAVGVDDYRAGVLPEDKAEFVRNAKADGHTVMMIGDGVNDSPALSEADVGIAINSGAAIAKEVADITIASDDLFELVTLRRVSTALMNRIHSNYRFIVSFNTALIVLGVAGIIPPTFSALLHNMSTLGISLKSMTNLLPAPKTGKEHPCFR